MLAAGLSVRALVIFFSDSFRMNLQKTAAITPVEQENHLQNLHFSVPSQFSGGYLPGTPRPTIYKWLFQLDGSQSLHRKWLEITISIHFLMVGNGVPGRN